MNRGPLIGLIVSLVILVFVGAGYGFWYSLLSQKSADVASITEKIAEQNDATAKIEEAKSELAQLSTQESSIDQYFVATNDVVPFLEQIQAIGKFLGAKVEVVSVSAAPGTPYGQLNLALSITGSFDAVARTLGSIEYGPYDSTITSLTFTTNPPTGTTASSSAAVWNAAAEFTVGAQTGNPEASAPTAPVTPNTTAQTSSAPSAPTTTPATVTATSTTPVPVTSATASSSTKFTAE